MEKSSEIRSYSNGEIDVTFPFLHMKGAAPGPTVTLTAGLHGSEYPGIFAVTKLFQTLNPENLKGTLNIIPILNLPAFENRSMFVCPVDGKNPNRCFPGKKDGSYTEILVYHVLNDFIEGSDYYVDMHSGDLVENLLPLSIIHQSGNSEVDKKAVELAQCFGFPYIVTSGEKYAGTSNVTAAKYGVPGIIVEVGGMGQACPEHVELGLAGLYNVLKYAGCLQGTAQLKTDVPRYNTYIWIQSEKKGIFHNNCVLGQAVAQGDILGFVADYLGNEIEVIRAPVSAKILIATTSPAVAENGLLMALGGE